MECWVVTQSQNYQITTAEPLVSFTHWIEYSKGSKPEKFASTIDIGRDGKKISKYIGRVQSKMQLRERMVFALPSSAKPKIFWQRKTGFQCCIQVQRSMPKAIQNNETASTMTNSSSRWKPQKKQLKCSISFNLFPRSVKLNLRSG